MRIKLETTTVPMLGQDEVRVAAAQALTQVASKTRLDIREKLPSSYILRNTWTQRNVAYRPADPETLEAKVEVPDYMERHEEGGTKKARGGRVAIPVGVRSSEREIVQPGQRPRALKDDKRVFLLDGLKGGAAGLFRREGKGKDSSLTLLYWLVPQVEIDQSLGLVDAAEQQSTKFGKAFGTMLSRLQKPA